MILAEAPAAVTWLVLVTAALIAGFAKTSIGGLGAITVALGTLVMPAREATAAMLMLLLVGDACAVLRYRRDADVELLRRVVPAVLPGLVIGTGLLAVASDGVLRRGIGATLLGLVLLQLLLRRRTPRPGRVAGIATGVAAGTTTMVANAAGPVMTLYLVAQGVDKRRFLGTNAWFFAGVNLCKVPFLVALGLVDRALLLQTLGLAPFVVAGALLGIRTAAALGQRSFDVAVLAACAVSATALLVL